MYTNTRMKKGELKMKSNYVVRARKLMNALFPYLRRYPYRIDLAVRHFNEDKHMKIQCESGLIRRCVICSDYVIKWDYNRKGRHTFGGCKEEYTFYQDVKDTEYSHLFAEITPIEVRGHIFYVMPKVDVVAVSLPDNESDNIEDHISIKEYEYIFYRMGFSDIHNENWGMLHGEPIIFDYACRR